MKLATQVQSKPASKVPVTKHPLFPAMVALWFGALFGLGSLAVRASLLESLVLSLSLDVLLPVAAPPLGMKFRLILALLLAAIGVALGAILARRIARPRPVQAPRRRGIGSKMSGRQDRDAALTEADETATRRRPLTVKEDEGYDRHYEAAPLPGGSPAILDVTQMDISPAEDQVLEPRESEPLAAEVEAPLALDAFVIEEPAQAIGQAGEAVVDQVFKAAPQTTQPERQVFRPVEPEPAAVAFSLAEEPEPVALNFHPPVDASVPPQEAPLDLLAEQEVAPAAQIPAEPEVAEYAQIVEQLRRIESPMDGHGEQPAPAQWTGEPPAEWTGEPPVSHVQSEPEAEAAPLEVAIDSGSDQVQWSSEPLPVVPPALLADPLPLVAASPVQAPVGNRIETAELSTLSPVELIERLAQAMRQRAHQGEMPESLVAAVSSLAAPLGVAVAMPVVEAAPIANQLDQLLQHDELVLELPEETPLAPVPLALPSALRPIDFSDYADDDDDIDNVSLPPRSFAPSAGRPAAADLTPPEPEAIAPGEAPLAAEVGDGEAEVPEESYSSLLELGRPAAARQDFVRIEEPEEDSATIEPVVIFPGHGARPGLRFAAPDPASQSDQANPATDSAGPFAAVADGDAPQLRRFDPPTAVASTGPSAHVGGIRQDPEEAQRALRSALATLQRMSGAA